MIDWPRALLRGRYSIAAASGCHTSAPAIAAITRDRTAIAAGAAVAAATAGDAGGAGVARFDPIGPVGAGDAAASVAAGAGAIVLNNCVNDPAGAAAGIAR